MKKSFITLIITVLFAAVAFGALDDEKKISIELNTSLEQSFNIIAKVAKINIFMDDGIPKGKPVQIRIDQLSIKETLDIMMKLNGLKMEKINENSIIVFPAEKDKQYSVNETRTFYLKNADVRDIGNMLMVTVGTGKVYVNNSMNSVTVNASYEEMEQIKRIIEDVEREELYVEKTFFLSYMKPEDAVELVTKVRKVTKYSTNKTLNSITMQLKSDEVDGIAKLIKGLDIKPSQAVVEITLLDASASLSDTIEVDWKNSVKFNDLTQTSGWMALLPTGIGASQIKATADILANPTIRVINNETAKINIGERVPIVIAKPSGISGTGTSSGITVPSVEYKDVGIQMEVIPTVHADNEITIKLNLEVSSLGETSTHTEYGDYPLFVTKNISTIIRLKDGETGVFGGLINNEERTRKVSIPFIGDLPIFGELFFTKKEKEPKKGEIIMLITPRIVNLNAVDKSDAIREFDKQRSEKTKQLLNEAEKNAKK